MGKLKKVLSLLIFIIIPLIGILFMPVTVSRYVGSHTWIGEPKCTGCHPDIVSELRKSEGIWPHLNVGNQTQCLRCHNLYGSAHNITYLECMECHNRTSSEFISLNNSIHGNYTHGLANSKGCMACHTDVEANYTKV